MFTISEKIDLKLVNTVYILMVAKTETLLFMKSVVLLCYKLLYILC